MKKMEWWWVGSGQEPDSGTKTHRMFEVLNDGKYLSTSKSSRRALFCWTISKWSVTSLPAPNSHIAAGVYICKQWEKTRHCEKVLRNMRKNNRDYPTCILSYVDTIVGFVTYFKLFDVKYLARSVFIWTFNSKSHGDKCFLAWEQK